jgi:hypothetical protein
MRDAAGMLVVERELTAGRLVVGARETGTLTVVGGRWG